MLKLNNFDNFASVLWNNVTHNRAYFGKDLVLDINKWFTLCVSKLNNNAKLDEEQVSYGDISITGSLTCGSIASWEGEAAFVLTDNTVFSQQKTITGKYSKGFAGETVPVTDYTIKWSCSGDNGCSINEYTGELIIPITGNTNQRVVCTVTKTFMSGGKSKSISCPVTQEAFPDDIKFPAFRSSTSASTNSSIDRTSNFCYIEKSSVHKSTVIIQSVTANPELIGLPELIIFNGARGWDNQAIEVSTDFYNGTGKVQRMATCVVSFSYNGYSITKTMDILIDGVNSGYIGPDAYEFSYNLNDDGVYVVNRLRVIVGSYSVGILYPDYGGGGQGPSSVIGSSSFDVAFELVSSIDGVTLDTATGNVTVPENTSLESREVATVKVTVTYHNTNESCEMTTSITQSAIPIINRYLTFDSGSNTSYISLHCVGSTNPKIYYKTDSTDWTLATMSSTSSLIDQDFTGKIYVAGYNGGGLSTSETDYCYFSLANFTPVRVSGNIMSLINCNQNTATTGEPIPCNFCFYRLFANCDASITTTPDLFYSESITDYCYKEMFKGCTGLTTVSELPADYAPYQCYMSMFEGCTSLIKAPELPARTIEASCYYRMFKDCTALTNAPTILPCTSLTHYCYESMFHGCTNLKVAPELPANELVLYCYNKMFYNCTKLCYIKALFTSTPNIDYSTYNWVYNVASSGVFIKNPDATWDVTGVNGIPTTWVDASKSLKITSNGNNRVDLRFITSDSNYPTSVNYYYVVTIKDSNVNIDTCKTISSTSKNFTDAANCPGCEWTYTTSYSNFDVCYIQCYNDVITSYSSNVCNNFVRVHINGDAAATVSGYTSAICSFTNKAMFMDSEGLISAENLIVNTAAQVLSKQYAMQLFYNCTNLVTPPTILSAKTCTNYVYAYMFYNCTSLTSLPEISANILDEYCYFSMFRGCTSLTSIPTNYLPVTNVCTGCYANMFDGCTNIANTCLLLAETLKTSCYGSMFKECTSLTKTPESLPATTSVSAAYMHMFEGCTSLEWTPIICLTSMKSTSCAKYMFLDSSVHKACILATSWCGALAYGNNSQFLETNVPTGKTGKAWITTTPDAGYGNSSSTGWGNATIPQSWIQVKCSSNDDAIEKYKAQRPSNTIVS